jgi:phosphatidylinositol glycan class Z
MLLLRWLWIGNGKDGEIPPIAVFWTLRVLMFVISFVLEDWALHELIPSPKHRRVAVVLVASSYVTWTYQTHTFSNSVETLVVAWSLVLIQRVADPRVRYLYTITTDKDYQLTFKFDTQQRSCVLSATVLGIVGVFGIFNRITFPAFLVVPGLRLLPVFWKR